jgi:hypothetical protein
MRCVSRCGILIVNSNKTANLPDGYDSLSISSLILTMKGIFVTLVA